MKNKVEIHGDIALIHINRAGVTQIAIMDSKFYCPYIQKLATHTLTLDSNGFVQHKKKVNGKWEVFQVHREIVGAFSWERVGFRNGNKLDLRHDNLVSNYQ